MIRYFNRHSLGDCGSSTLYMHVCLSVSPVFTAYILVTMGRSLQFQKHHWDQLWSLYYIMWPKEQFMDSSKMHLKLEKFNNENLWNLEFLWRNSFYYQTRGLIIQTRGLIILPVFILLQSPWVRDKMYIYLVFSN